MSSLLWLWLAFAFIFVGGFLMGFGVRGFAGF